MTTTQTLSNQCHNDIADQYDIYYHGAQDSLYNKRLGEKRTTLNEESVVINTFKELIKNLPNNQSKIIRILDFGCGDGRIFPVIEKLANQYKTAGFSFYYAGYDPCNTGLINFKNSLLANGYSEDNLSLIRDNLTVSLILGDVNEELNLVAKKIGNNFDICLCMYGVLSHIPYRQNRINHLKMINSILVDHGELLISVCSKNFFAKELFTYDVIRKQLADCNNGGLEASVYVRQQMLRLATESGGLYYCYYPSFTNKAIDIFAHIYTPNELKKDLQDSNFRKNLKIKVMSTLNIYDITNSFIKDFIDMLFSRLLTRLCFSDDLKSKFGKHIYISCQKK